MEQLSWGRDGGLAVLVERAERMLLAEPRMVLGLAGAPASGKSTLAAALVQALSLRHPGEVTLVGMDAFHLGHQVLVRHGLVDVKGAPHTFDALGYVALLRRLRSVDDTVYAPEFHREIEDSLAQSVEISPAVRLVITEGNYLLLPSPPWDQVRPQLDEAWFVHLEDTERQRRMVVRHRSFGHSLDVARLKALGSDETNAQLVNRSQNNPDLWIEQLT